MMMMVMIKGLAFKRNERLTGAASKCILYRRGYAHKGAVYSRAPGWDVKYAWQYALIR